MKIRTLEDARALRAKMETLSKYVPDNEAPLYSEFFPVWSASKSYSQNDRVQFNDLVYKYIGSLSGASSETPEENLSWIKLTGDTDEE